MELQKLIDGLKARRNGAASYISVDEAIRVFEAIRDVDGEKAVKGLECCRHLYPKHCDACEYYTDDCTADLADDALALIRQQQERIEELEAGPKWISVKDRLPDDGKFVLVCNDDGKMMIAKHESEVMRWEYKYTNYDWDVWDDDEQGPVCYWMFLPEPPKEEEHGTD